MLKNYRGLLLTVLAAFVCVLVVPVLSVDAASTDYGSPKAKSTPAATQQAEEDVAAEEEDDCGWFGAFKIKMAAKHYDITQEQAKALYKINEELRRERKRLNREEALLLADLEELVNNGAPEIELTAKRDEVKELRVQQADAENAAIDKVWDLLGPEKASRWLLARREFFAKIKSSVARSSSGDDVKKEKEPRCQHGMKTGY